MCQVTKKRKKKGGITLRGTGFCLVDLKRVGRLRNKRGEKEMKGDFRGDQRVN